MLDIGTASKDYRINEAITKELSISHVIDWCGGV